MFGQLELSEYLASHQMSPTTCELVDRIRHTQSDFNPFNNQGTRTVVTIRSVKMQQGVTVQSRTLHASAAMWYEFDEKIKEYYASAHAFTAITHREDGSVANKSQHWFDFLILGDGAPRFEDWKEETVLFQMQKKDDDRWKKVGRFWRDEFDRWHDRACEQYCGQLGISHRLRTNREIPRRFLENIRYLRDFYDPRTPILSSDTAERLRRCVQNGPVSFDDMLKREGFEADVLLSAIVQGVLFVDLNSESIGNPADLLMHRDADLAEADRLIRRGDLPCDPLPIPGLAACPIGTRLQYGGEEWTVILGSTGPDAEVLLTTSTGRSMSLPAEIAKQLLAERATDEERVSILNNEKRRALASLSKTDLKDGIKKYKAVILDEGADQYSDATLGRCRRAIRGCTSVHDTLLALTPHHAGKGNRSSRLAPIVELLAKTTIETVHNTASAGSAKKTYETYCVKCAEQGVVPMSYPTLCKRVKELEDPNARFGKRVAYRDGQIPLILDARESVDGVMPHDICYIDHTEPNLFTKGSEGQDLGKLWLSAAVDGNVTCARAFYLSYRPPSALSVLMIFRDYVRRWKRLPRVVVLDGGRDMRAYAVEQFCKIHNIDVRYRAGGRPRGGKDIERLFGLTEEELLSGLAGCSIQLKEARTVTKSVDPTRRAEWTFPELYRSMDAFLFDFRFRRHIHPGLGMTQYDFEQARLKQTGRRDHMRVEFDEDLLLLTAPSPPRGEHKVHAQRGVWESGMFYWNPAFVKIGGKRCQVRYEPWLANVIYVNVGNAWETALARDLEPYWGRTRYEVEYAKRMERNFNRLAAERDRHTTSRAVHLAKVRTPTRFDETIAKKQEIESELYKALGMGAARVVDFGVVPRREPGCNTTSAPDSSEVEMASDAGPQAGGESAVEFVAPVEATHSEWSDPDEAGLL